MRHTISCTEQVVYTIDVEAETIEEAIAIAKTKSVANDFIRFGIVDSFYQHEGVAV